MTLPNTPYSTDLKRALSLADIADAITLPRFQAMDFHVDTKPDLTPVTDVDQSVETALRQTLANSCPDKILGEEFGGTHFYTGRQWVIDPIDATKNFIRGIPIWATLIALLDQGIPRVGVISAPALHRRWWAIEGQGAFCSIDKSSPRRLSVSTIENLNQASLSLSSLSGWAQRGIRRQLIDLTDQVWRVRGFGDFWHYCLLAEGAVDIALEPEVSLWDLAALDILVREAGGIFTNISGIPGPHGGSAVASNGRLHNYVLDALKSSLM